MVSRWRTVLPIIQVNWLDSDREWVIYYKLSDNNYN